MTLDQFKSFLNYYEEYINSADYSALALPDKIIVNQANISFIAWMARHIEERE